MSDSSKPTRLQNLYVARLTAQEKPCFVCNKFTAVVLTSADNSNADWFYICRSHLGDFNFCSKIGSSPKPAKTDPIKKEPNYADRKPESDSVTELVSSLGSAWNSWRGKKTDEENKKENTKEDDKKGDDKKEEEKKEEDPKKETLETHTSPASPTSPPKPVRFVIQRDYFYLRQREYTKKIQKKEAAEKLKTLQFPEVPKNLPSKPK